MQTKRQRSAQKIRQFRESTYFNILHIRPNRFDECTEYRGQPAELWVFLTRRPLSRLEGPTGI